MVAVALSGGRDSTALLHAVLRQTQGSSLQVLALHVHHGLMPQADGWLAHLRHQCRRWRRVYPHLHFEACRLSGAPESGQSVEAWARRERYAALARMAKAGGAGLVLLAHHRRDQAETVLLQALRGGGPAGLSAMPSVIQRDGLCWARPWLDQPAQAIDSYVARHRLRHIEDDSNQDPRFDRNRLRLTVLPALRKAFPNAEAQLTRAARQAQAAAALIAEVAAQDLAALGDPLPVPAWLALSPARRRFALQAWLQQHHAAAPDSLLERLMVELPPARQGRWPLAPQRHLRLYRGVLLAESVAALRASADGALQALPVCLAQPLMQAPGWGGRLLLEPCEQGGVPERLLAQAWLGARQGGEQFQRALHTPPRSLKKQFQAAAIPAWARNAPLLLAGPAGAAQLLYVPGLGVDARILAQAGEPQRRPLWLPDKAPPA